MKNDSWQKLNQLTQQLLTYSKNSVCWNDFTKKQEFYFWTVGIPNLFNEVIKPWRGCRYRTSNCLPCVR